jgi:xanthine/uracil permease
MLNSLGILLISAVIVWIEVPTLLKNKQKKELIIFSVFLVIGIGMGMTIGFGKTIPNPTEFLSFILKPLSDLLTKLTN